MLYRCSHSGGMSIATGVGSSAKDRTWHGTHAHLPVTMVPALWVQSASLRAPVALTTPDARLPPSMPLARPLPPPPDAAAAQRFLLLLLLLLSTRYYLGAGADRCRGGAFAWLGSLLSDWEVLWVRGLEVPASISCIEVVDRYALRRRPECCGEGWLAGAGWGRCDGKRRRSGCPS